MQHIFLVLMVSIMAVNCGKDSSSDSNSQFKDSIAGAWETECIDFGSDTWVKSRVEFEDDTKTLVLKYYGNSVCSGALRTGTTTSAHDITGASSVVEDAYETTSTVTTLTNAFNDADLVTSANAEVAYGYDDWKINKTKNVAGKKYSESDEESEDKVGKVIYGLISANGDFLVGSDFDSGDGSTEAKRPTKLSSVKFTKVD